MKVALVNRRFTTDGGTERFMVGLARSLRENGHMVHIHSNEVRADLRAEPGLAFHRLGLLRPAKNASLWWNSAGIEADAVMAFGRCRGHDVLRAGGGAHAAWQQVCRPRWGLDPSEWVERFVDRDTARNAKVVITPSQRAGDDLARCYGLAPARLRVIHNGVDAERFRPGPGGEGLVFLGSGFARKGLAVAIEVAATLGRPLTVLGSDRGLARWQARHPDVRFVGAVPDPENWLGRYDALLLPTVYEPFGNVCLEAMACGTPAITTSVNGVSEVLPLDFIADGVDAMVASTEGALAGGAAHRVWCRELAVAMPRSKAYQAVERVLLQERR